MAAAKAETRAQQLSEYQDKLDLILNDLLDGRSRTIKRGEQTGAWLSVLPSTVNRTKLSAQEFHDALLMRYDITPPDLPQTCDGCESRFTLQHALGCKKGGPIIFHHKEIRNEQGRTICKAATYFFCNKTVLTKILLWVLPWHETISHEFKT
jgi:hypothetical protein